MAARKAESETMAYFIVYKLSLRARMKQSLMQRITNLYTFCSERFQKVSHCYIEQN